MSEDIEERLKRRRRRMEDTQVMSDEEPTPRKPADDTWAAAMQDDTPGNHPAEETEEDAAKLQKTVLRRRQKAKSRLEESTIIEDDAEDISSQLRSAKRRTRQKMLEEARKEREAGESTEDLSDGGAIPELPTSPAIGEDDGETSKRSSPSASLRATSSPRRMLGEDLPPTTPRRMSAALGSSMRARLAEKMKAAKDKGKDEVYDEARSTPGGLRGRRAHHKPTRFDDVSQEDEERIERTLTSRMKFKETVQKQVMTKSQLPTREESYDFFTRIWEEEPEEELPWEEPPPEETPQKEEPKKKKVPTATLR